MHIVLAISLSVVQLCRCRIDFFHLNLRLDCIVYITLNSWGLHKLILQFEKLFLLIIDFLLFHCSKDTVLWSQFVQGQNTVNLSFGRSGLTWKLRLALGKDFIACDLYETVLRYQTAQKEHFWVLIIGELGTLDTQILQEPFISFFSVINIVSSIYINVKERNFRGCCTLPKQCFSSFEFVDVAVLYNGPVCLQLIVLVDLIGTSQSVWFHLF